MRRPRVIGHDGDDHQHEFDEEDFAAPGSSSNTGMTAADYFRLLNADTAKFIAVCLIIGFSIYHGVLHVQYGVTPCKGLLKDGVYKEGGDGLWQPWGCMMHKYTKTYAYKENIYC